MPENKLQVEADTCNLLIIIMIKLNLKAHLKAEMSQCAVSLIPYLQALR